MICIRIGMAAAVATGALLLTSLASAVDSVPSASKPAQPSSVAAPGTAKASGAPATPSAKTPEGGAQAAPPPPKPQPKGAKPKAATPLDVTVTVKHLTDRSIDVPYKDENVDTIESADCHLEPTSSTDDTVVVDLTLPSSEACAGLHGTLKKTSVVVPLGKRRFLHLVFNPKFRKSDGSDQELATDGDVITTADGSVLTFPSARGEAPTPAHAIFWYNGGAKRGPRAASTATDASGCPKAWRTS